VVSKYTLGVMYSHSPYCTDMCQDIPYIFNFVFESGYPNKTDTDIGYFTSRCDRVVIDGKPSGE
jgi:hypothetical protein